MNNCVNLRVRRKKGQIYFFCVKKKGAIERKECLGCNYITFKKTPKMSVKTPFKKVSKKRVVVSEKTYGIVLDRCKDKYGVAHCQFCGATDNLQLHHVHYRSERKDLIDDPDNCLMLCHRDFSVNKCHSIVHNNKKKYKPILLNILEQQKKT